MSTASLVEDVKQNGFFCKWRVENFRYILYEEEKFIDSPIFVIRQLSDAQWCLRLEVCAYTLGNSIACGLVRVDANAQNKIKIKYEISVIANDLSFSKTISKSNAFSKYQRNIMHDFSLETFHGIKNVSLNDSLNICCRIWKIGEYFVYSMQWFPRTYISVHKKSFQCSIDQFTCLKKDSKASYVLQFETEEISPPLTIFIYWVSSSEKIQIEVNRKPCKRQYLTFNLSILDIKGNIEISQKFGILHKYNKLYWQFELSLPVKYILQMKDKYLLNDKLTFKCEIGICSGDKISEVVESNIEEVPSYSASNVNCVQRTSDANQAATPAYSSEKDVNQTTTPEISTIKDLNQTATSEFNSLKNVNQTTTPESSSLKDLHQTATQEFSTLKIVSQTAAPESSTLKDALLDLYKKNKFCDVVIKTESSSFPTHKSVLCARSLVFCAMFDADLEEKRSGIVEISDLNDDTIQKMLTFMYSDTLKDIEWESAINLFYASNKYDIVPLRHQCAMFLKSHMNISNVTDILVIADQHQDEDLKSASLDFILKNDVEVISSDLWKDFMESNFKLAAETTHLIFKKKLDTTKL